MRTNISFLALVLSLAGCANGYQQFFQYEQGATPDLINSLRVKPPTGTPIVHHISAQDIQTYQDKLIKDGYIPIGNSSFTSGKAAQDQQAVDQGKLVGAELVVIIAPTDAGTVSGVMPISVPTTTTSYSTGTATAYGANGSVNAYGSGRTNTYGTQMAMIPYTVQRLQHGALYYFKRKFALGTHVRDLDDSERGQRKSNKGVIVHAVVNDTPAFNADILVGDIIESFNDEVVSGEASYGRFLDLHKGESVSIRLDRQGEKLTKTVKLNQ